MPSNGAIDGTQNRLFTAPHSTILGLVTMSCDSHDYGLMHLSFSCWYDASNLDFSISQRPALFWLGAMALKILSGLGRQFLLPISSQSIL